MQGEALQHVVVCVDVANSRELEHDAKLWMRETLYQIIDRGFRLFVARAAGSAGRWAGLVPEVVETLVRPYLDRPEAHRRTESFVRRVVGAGQTAVLVRLTDMAPLPMSDAAWRALVLAVAADATSARAKTRPGAVTAVLTGPYLRNGVLPAAVVLLVLVAIALIVQ